MERVVDTIEARIFSLLRTKTTNSFSFTPTAVNCYGTLRNPYRIFFILARK